MLSELLLIALKLILLNDILIMSGREVKKSMVFS